MGKNRGTMKVKKVSMVSKDDTNSLNTMFEQMTGLSNAEPDVIIPKILKLKQRIVKYNKVFNILINFTEFQNLVTEYKNWTDSIEAFLSNLTESTNTDLKINYDENNAEQVAQLRGVSDDDLNKTYKSLKENKYVKEIIITCSNLAPFKRYIEDKANLDTRFVLREPGLSLIPLSFSGLDLKLLWSIEEISDKGKNLIVSILHHIYTIGWEMYDIVSSPDVDIAKFSEILVDSITKLRKQIPRCDKAFDVIENSVKMLESNFKTYYKSSIEAENPSIIIESFIVDVSTSQKASPIVTSQFKKIVAFLKQRSANINDPKVKKLFGMLNSQFSAMDKELGVKTAPDEDVPEEAPEEKKLDDVTENSTDF